MALHFKKIEGLLNKKESKTQLERIIIDYSVLKRKLENLDEQSIYFHQGLESNKQRLISLNKDFEEIRDFYNTTSIDFMLNVITENERGMLYFEQNGMGMVSQIHYSSMRGENRYFKELIRLKSITKLLLPIDD